MAASALSPWCEDTHTAIRAEKRLEARRGVSGRKREKQRLDPIPESAEREAQAAFHQRTSIVCMGHSLHLEYLCFIGASK